jgi:hypothetical protein
MQFAINISFVIIRESPVKSRLQQLRLQAGAASKKDNKSLSQNSTVLTAAGDQRALVGKFVMRLGGGQRQARNTNDSPPAASDRPRVILLHIDFL